MCRSLAKDYLIFSNKGLMRNKIIVIIIGFMLLYSFISTSENGELFQHSDREMSVFSHLNNLNEKNPYNFLTSSYYIFFNETGLPSNSNWSVVLKGLQGSTLESTTSNQIIFYVVGGNYSVTIYVPNGYTITSQSGKLYSLQNQQNGAGGGKNISKGYLDVQGNEYIPVNIITDNNGSDLIIVTSIVVSLIAVLFVLYYYTRFYSKSKAGSK